MKKFIYLLFCLGQTMGFLHPAQAQIITTVAGDGSIHSFMIGEGGPATNAEIKPVSVVLDTVGNLYVVDGGNHRMIHKINISGIITLFAGTTYGGLISDGVPATAEELNPTDIAIDNIGNIYLTDKYSTTHGRVRKINTSGIITTVAGSATTTIVGDGGPATNANLDDPEGIAVDWYGNIYITDLSGHRIRKVDTTGIISTIAGTGSPAYSGDGFTASAASINAPEGIFVDGTGNVYFCDKGNHRIRKIDASGIITTIAGTGVSGFSGDGGPATAAQVGDIIGISIDKYGNIYFTCDAHHLRKINAAGIISTVAGTATTGYNGEYCNATAAELNFPTFIAADTTGNIYIADQDNNRLRKITIDHPPHFTGGPSQGITICTSIGYDSLNSLLAIIDTDTGQTETWSVISGPSHGLLVASDTNTSTGGIITPTGLYYTATVGYTGNDSFQVQIADCSGLADTTTVYISIVGYVSSVTLSGTSGVCMGSTVIISPTYGGGVWSSSNTSIASVGSTTGIVSGVSAGTTTISYSISLTCGSASAGMPVTVSPVPAAIGGSGSLCAGATATLTDATSGGVWSSGSTGIATIGTTGMVMGISGGIALISYTLSTGCRAIATETVNPIPAAMTGTGTVCAGQTTTFGCTTPGGTWSSSAGTIASAGSTGIVTGVSAGTATITYALPTGCINMKTVTVNTAPAGITGTMNICTGINTTLADGTTGGAWSANNTNATVGSGSGIVSGITAGPDTIKYTLVTGCNATAIVTVNTSPSAITGSGSVCTGASITLADATTGGVWSTGSGGVSVGSSSGVITGVSASVAVITYALSTGCQATKTITVNTTPVGITGTMNICSGFNTTLADGTTGGAWSASNTNATIGSGAGIVSGITAGTDTIKYTLVTGCDATAIVTINASPSAITGSGSVCTGTSITLTDATTGGVWSTGSGSVSVGSSSGVITGVTAGVAVITYALSTGCQTTKTVTVNTTPVGITGSSAVCIGSTITLTDGTSGGTWSSSNPGIATIGSGTGTAAGSSPGTVIITYALATGCSTTISLSVNPVPASITGLSAICPGDSTILSESSTGGIWSPSTGGIATAGSAGIVTGISGGAVTISYILSTGCAAVFPLTVNPAPATITGSVGICLTYTSVLSDTTSGGYWTSSDYSIADVGAGTGVVTGMTSGTAVITYTLGSGCFATITVSVNPGPTAISGLATICQGVGSLLFDAVSGGVWSSGSPGIVDINSATGQDTGKIAGSAIINYSTGTGCTVNFPITVNPSPAAIGGTPTVCLGNTTTLTDATTGGTWSSTSPVATIVGSTGVVTGLATGMGIIAYTSPNGCYVTKVVTVIATTSPITGPSQVCVNGTATLTDPTGGGTWTSSSTAIATIGSASGILTGLLSGTVTVTYSIGAGCSATKVITVNPLPAPISGTPVVCVGSATTLSDPTPGGVWSSTVVANGSISTSGVLTGIAAGNTVIDYTLPATGCSRAVTATVNPQPAVISGPLVVCQGATIALSDATAGGTWSAGTGTISLGTGTGIVLGVSAGTAAVTYALSTGCARTKIITVNPLPSGISGPASLCQGATASLTDAGGGVWSTISSSATIGSLTGLVSGVSGGTALITYTLSTGCSVTRTETINPLPMPISGPGALCPGTTMTLTDAGGGTWSSMTPAVATIGTTTGVVSGLITGTTTVTYTLPTGCTTSKAVTVSTTPTAIAGSSTVCLGGTTTLTDTVTGGSWFSAIPTTASIGTLSGIVTGSATGVTTITYSLGTGCTVTKTITVVPSPAAITGSSSICISGTTPMTDATTGGIWSAGTGSVSVSSTGVVTGVAAGVATIYYTVAGCTATKGITVNATPTPISGSGSVCAGATITESDGTGGGVWSASGTAITVGSGSGIVTGSVAGSGTLTYSIGSCSISRIISVNPVPSLSGATGICTGTTSTLTASITGGTWYSSAGCVSAGSATGIITGVSPGTATITYTLASGCTASVAVTVNGAPGAITGTLHVCAGATTALSDGTGGGIWSIAPATVASIGSSSGIVSGNLSGTATVTYSLGSGCTKTAIVTVNAVPAAIAGTAQVCAGLTTSLSDATTGGIWSAGPGSVSVSGAGVVTGIATGTATIAYTVSGCSATVPFTVNPLPSAIAGTSSLCAGLSTPFTDITSGGTWSTGSGIAGVGSGSGMVSGISAGTAIITYSLPTGCMATKTIIINSAPLTISGGSMVCVGSALALTDGTSGGIWSSANMAVGSIGTTGVVTGLSTGTTVISYTVGGCPAMKTVTVNTPPGPISGPAIVCISATVNAMDAGGGLWSSSNPVIATIGTSSGIISGVAAGTATITYSLGAGCTVTEMITVNPLPASITASTSNVCSGATLALSDATPGGAWGSGSPGVATVGTTGLVTGGTAGISIITYTAPSGCMATRSITVISVAPISGVHNICAYGDTMTVSNVPGTGLYTSSLVTITNLGGGLGRVTGNTPGSASVTYILPAGCTGTAWFTVNPLPATIAGSGSVCVGSTAALTDATPGGTWSAGAGIVSVGSGSGVVTGITGGTGYVTYTLTSTGCKVDTSEMVYTLPAAITGPASLFLGTPVTLSDAVTGGLWSSSNTLVATVVAGTGHVTGISVGAVTITYATGGICPVTKHLTVMPSAGRSGPPEVEQGATERGNAVRVSPNPGDGGFTIDLTWATEETVHISISNVAGMKIKDWSMVTVKDGVVSMPVQIDVASGVYLLSVDGNDYKYMTKVVVER